MRCGPCSRQRTAEEYMRADLTSAIASHSMMRAHIKFKHVMIHAMKQGMEYWSSSLSIPMNQKGGGKKVQKAAVY